MIEVSKYLLNNKIIILIIIIVNLEDLIALPCRRGLDTSLESALNLSQTLVLPGHPPYRFSATLFVCPPNLPNQATASTFADNAPSPSKTPPVPYLQTFPIKPSESCLDLTCGRRRPQFIHTSTRSAFTR